MRILVKEAILRCGHDGKVENVPSQEWVRVHESPILVDNDPQGRDISMCPHIGINIKPCNKTMPVTKGYSTFISIGGKAVCLDTVEGFTDGTPPGAVKYNVRRPGQTFVGAGS
ncbi:hypothetical protein ACIQC5_18945 [Paenarthrobacter sp. NPDC092416]|uniref:hypothetical protein n=1 Tax=Paenarthrobacter sp. NPDC092416 TaxID=3364386 RepID=UPI00382CAAC2